ncbi:MAG: lipoyl(octanoyl) transferase LipB, partial [Thermoplasmata archaeon]
EAVVVDALAAHGVSAGHVSGRHGVWVAGERKIASVGIAVERWVTFHGFALNVDLDLAPFEQFRPCGLSGSLMTSLARERGGPVSVDSVKPSVIAAWNARFGSGSGSAGSAAVRDPGPVVTTAA